MRLKRFLRRGDSLAMKIFLETTIPSYITARPSRDMLRFSHQQLTREWWETRRQFHQLFTPEQGSPVL
jgi:hypothetical protein